MTRLTHAIHMALDILALGSFLAVLLLAAGLFTGDI